MQVRDVMSSPAISVRPDLPVGRAAALLVTHGFTAAPVVTADGRLLGLVTESDLMNGRIAREGEPVDQRRDGSAEPPVSAVMTPRPTVVDPETDLADLAAVMLTARTRSLPVVRDGKLIGMVTPRDVLRAIATRTTAAPRIGR